ncbi:MAG: ATP-grasp domain-containing protein [Candidatus Bathyarchaeota archaeon]|nr:MAG: ATP-grasp domain-containing protein [Candidatus Bathyarchaeota archaeon]
MSTKKIRSLLIVGLDVVSLAKSAKRAGYEVYSVDYYGDSDLRKTCNECKSLIVQIKGKSCGRLNEKFNPRAILKLAKILLQKHHIDGVILSSGLEDSHQILSELNDHIPILGNTPKTIQRVRDKTSFFKELDRIQISHPITEEANNLREANNRAKDIGYPIVVKPLWGSGGTFHRKAIDSKTLKPAFKIASSQSSKVLIQEYVHGISASASLLSASRNVLTLTINEQLLGMRRFGQQEPFGYCGNIVPLSIKKTITKRCRYAVEKVASHFKLAGSNGVDFVLSEEGEPKIVEINPRFQGTAGCVESVLGINLVKTHIDACVSGIIPNHLEPSICFCTRIILYAKKRSNIPYLNFDEVEDIPVSGTIVEKGEPICSITSKGSSRKESFNKAKRIADSIYNLAEPVYLTSL